MPLAGWRLFYFHQQIHVHVTRSHHVMSYCIISCHIMSCIQTCIQILSNVKGLLISPFMERHSAYDLRQICIEFMYQWRGGGGVKKVWTTLGVNIFGYHSGWVKDFSGISLSYLPVLPSLRNVHELMSRGGGQKHGPHLDSQNIWMTIRGSKCWSISLSYLLSSPITYNIPLY